MSYKSIIFLLFLCYLDASNSNIVPLTGNDWIINDNGSYLTQGQVPGTIHTILLAANLIAEPFSGYNDISQRHLIYTPWTFKKNFSLTDDILMFTQFTLHFDQIDTVANITLNQCFIGQTNNMFLAYNFNVMKSCLKSDNELRIDFESPVIYVYNQAQAYNDTVPPDCPPDIQYGECHVNFIRKEPCSFSWDWAPAFAPIGITGNLYLQAINNATVSIQLESVNVASYRKPNNTWQVDVLLSSNNDPFTSQLKFVLQSTSFAYETNITFNRNLSVSLLIPNDTVQLWWPNGYGNQALYNLTVYNQGQLIGSRSIGFRTIELAQHGYGPNINGTSFYFIINGHPIFIKGSNWVPPDAFQERVTDERFERLLRSAQIANINMLRIWGGGIYERDSFYDMADRLGIMLWHDFMFACSLYPVDEPFLTNVYNEIIYQVKRLQSHPSIALWAGNNENEAAVAENWYRVPIEKMPQVKDNYRKLYVSTVMRAVQEIDKGNNRPFITSSPTNGLQSIKEDYIATNPQDPLYGDVHFYGFNNDSWNPNTYPLTRFLSETGSISSPSLDSWQEVTQNATDLQYESLFVKHREHDTKIYHVPYQIESNLPTPVTKDLLKNFTQWIYLTQINQAMTLKGISDWCRVHSSVDMIDPKTSQGHNMGIMYWQIDDFWQAPTSATIEYGLKWKLSHYYVQHMYEPVYPLAILTPYLANVTDESARIQLYLINERFNGVIDQLHCSFLPLDSFSVRSSITFDISYTVPGVLNVAELPYSSVMRNSGCVNGNQCLFHCRFNSTQENIGQTLFLTQPKNYQLYQPNLHIQSFQQVSSTEVSITITATRPALFVWLDAPANVTGYFSRNGFHMFEPTKTISFYSWAPMNDFNHINFDLHITSLFDITEP